jgi:hypothetical protein
MIAGEDLSSYQYCFVKAGATVNTVEHMDATTDMPIGILMNAPTSGEAAEIALPGGGAKLKCDASVTNGGLITSTAAGLGTLAGTVGNMVYAQALPMGSTTASGDIIPVILDSFEKNITQQSAITKLATTTALTTLAVTASALTTLAVTSSTGLVTNSASIEALFDTKADNADVETLRTETQTALNTKADNADVETLRGEVEVRLDNCEVKIDGIITALKSAGVTA